MVARFKKRRRGLGSSHSASHYQQKSTRSLFCPPALPVAFPGAAVACGLASLVRASIRLSRRRRASGRPRRGRSAIAPDPLWITWTTTPASRGANRLQRGLADGDADHGFDDVSLLSWETARSGKGRAPRARLSFAGHERQRYWDAVASLASLAQKRELHGALLAALRTRETPSWLIRWPFAFMALEMARSGSPWAFSRLMSRIACCSASCGMSSSPSSPVRR